MVISPLLLIAVLPVCILLYYIYRKDINKEPKELLFKIFFLGFLSSIPIFFIELYLDFFFSTDGVDNFFQIFFLIFVSISLIEEGFKWFIVKKVGYSHKEFDEIYDIIVYATFASLGFACIENIVYVLESGYRIALLRGITAIPAHASFGIIMGYYLYKAKVCELDKRDGKENNLFLSLVIPSLLHTLYDSFLIYCISTKKTIFVFIFFIFNFLLVIFSFYLVRKVSKLQQSLK